ncbi:hypothetical protein [Streptacidiphilus monticola]|uniref:PE-PGRS family protein n=1 Tax=Streptacidiphilus monticola TaxID=2161674 RepID=A0ABW1G196_9ACTN
MEQDLMRELAAADLGALGERGFPVFAATAAGVTGTVLSSWERHGPSLVRLVLAAGDALAGDGPWLEVRTADEAAELPEHPLPDVIEDERDRLREHAGITDERGFAAEEPRGAVLRVDGVPYPVRLRREGPLWAARLRLRGVSLTVAGRGVAYGDVELAEVGDLEPFAVGRQELLVRLRERRRRAPAEPPPDEPLGLDAHRRLVDYCVAHALRVEAVTEHQEREDLWERAVRQQMRLAGEDREAADEAVSSLVSQMIALALSETWFPAGPEGERARDESIRFTAFASEVPSAPAQRAWRTDADPEAWLTLWRRWRGR